MEFLNDNIEQILFTFIVLIITVVLKFSLNRIINRYARKFQYSLGRKVYIKKTINFLILILASVMVGLTWEVSVKGLSIYFVSIFTLVGIAFFATWSVLSSITASVIIYFSYPMRIGDRIELIDDKTKPINGVILDITLFNIILIDEEKNMIICPNNYFLQKTVSKKYMKKDKKKLDKKKKLMNKS